jgi:tetratricopeptide (TPR) repeat protein
MQQAAALHEAAQLIFARLGNRRAEALAANALGVALAEIGEHDPALEQFERARRLLQELGDRHWQGKVLANIGQAKHRLGRDDEAVEHLQTALAHLTPQTEAYRRVERRLRHAS